MRAKEFITERTTKPLRKSAQASTPGLRKNTHLDNNNNPYLAYRFGVALAGSPTQTMDQKGPLGSNFITTDYTDVEAEIRQGAERIMGVSSEEVSTKGSTEMATVNSVSPVAKSKKNKYGI